MWTKPYLYVVIPSKNLLGTFAVVGEVFTTHFLRSLGFSIFTLRSFGSHPLHCPYGPDFSAWWHRMLFLLGMPNMYDFVEYVYCNCKRICIITQYIYIYISEYNTIYYVLLISIYFNFWMLYENGTLYCTCLQGLNVPFVYFHLRRDAGCGHRQRQRFGYEGAMGKQDVLMVKEGCYEGRLCHSLW